MSPACARHRVVHRRQHPIGTPDVRQHFDVELARKRRAPCALARADTAREPLLRVTVLEAVGGELHRLARADGQRYRAVRVSLVVERVDAYLARLVGVVDDPHKPQAAHSVGRRWEERNRLRLLRYLCGRRHGAERDDRRRERSPRPGPVKTVHLSRNCAVVVLRSALDAVCAPDRFALARPRMPVPDALHHANDQISAATIAIQKIMYPMPPISLRRAVDVCSSGLLRVAGEAAFLARRAGQRSGGEQPRERLARSR